MPKKEKKEEQKYLSIVLFDRLNNQRKESNKKTFYY